jgi:hypothetical protein
LMKTKFKRRLPVFHATTTTNKIVIV